MVQMSTMMNYSTNIMATGSKIILIYSADNNLRMFPFEDSSIAEIPVADTNHIGWNLRQIRRYYKGEVLVISNANGVIEQICDQYDAQHVSLLENINKQVYDHSKDCDQTILLTNGILLSDDMAKGLIQKLEIDEDVMYVSTFSEMVKSINTMGVSEKDGIVEAIYGHPRSHYVNGYSVGAFIVGSSIIEQFKHTTKGFNNINVGQMPDDKYYIENAIQDAIFNGEYISAEWVKREIDFTQLNFTYEIVETNQFGTRELLKTETVIDSTATIDESATITGKLRIGKNSVIGKNVVIRGDCWIGDNVTIDNGVIIGKNCLINSGTKIFDYALINDNTVLGNNNKIGFTAEVSGVTFEGISATHNCEVYGVIGKRVDIAAGVQTAILRFDDELVPVRIGNKKYSNKFTSYIAIGNYSRTGVNNVFAPGVRVGSRSAISPGIIVNRDVDHNTILKLEQNITSGTWGSGRYGW